MPKIPKILAIILISLLLVPFVFGVTLEVAPKYFNIVFPIILLVLVSTGIALYLRSIYKRRKRSANS